MKKIFSSCLLAFLLLFSANIQAQTDTIPEVPSLIPPEATSKDSILVTLILKHQQDKNLLEIRRKLETNGWWDLFPPEEVEIVSWQIVMGLGHIIVIKTPPHAIRKLNLAIENGVWGAYDTEIYLTYDYFPVFKEYTEKRDEYRKKN